MGLNFATELSAMDTMPIEAQTTHTYNTISTLQYHRQWYSPALKQLMLIWKKTLIVKLKCHKEYLIVAVTMHLHTLLLSNIAWDLGVSQLIGMRNKMSDPCAKINLTY